MKRATVHNARKGKDGTFSAKHNDRNFDIDNAEHIDDSRQDQNWYWQFYADQGEQMTFEECEQRYYEEHFLGALNRQNERHLARRQASRVRTMEQYRKSYKTCPEETLYYIGSAKDGSVDSKTLREVVMQQIRWEHKQFRRVVVLDVALHMDEGGAPHIHERKVWVSTTGKDGICVGQARALEEMGVERPDPSKKTGRYNNAKQTYTKACRDHFIKLCRDRGIEIIDEPQEKSKVGLQQDDYKAQRAQERTEAAQDDLRGLEAEKGIVSAAEVSEVEKRAKSPLFRRNKVIIDRSEYERLIVTAKSGKAALKRANAAARNERLAKEAAESYADDQVSVARQQADKMLQDANREAAKKLESAKKEYTKIRGYAELWRQEAGKFEPLHDEYINLTKSLETANKSLKAAVAEKEQLKGQIDDLREQLGDFSFKRDAKRYIKRHKDEFAEFCKAERRREQELER